jgi:hypothetical protein
MIFDFPREPAPLTLTTPFEDWCDAVGTHPEHPDAWSFYELSTGITDHTPAAS